MTRRVWLGLVLAVLGSGVCPAGAQPGRPGTEAPEVVGGPWINSAPLTRAALRGRGVLVEFWTYG